MTAIVELAGVAKEFGARARVVALRDVDLAIRCGDRLAITGPSGSGKTTLLQIVGLLERPTRGTVTVAGRDATTLSDAALSALRARALGLVFQDFHLLAHLTAEENVALGLLYHGVPARARRAAARSALDRVGLAARTGHRPGELSGGERQRVAIARAVVTAPSLVLADEPTGNLDSSAARAVLDLLVSFADDGAAVVVITHDPDVAARLDRRVRLRDGMIVAAPA